MSYPWPPVYNGVLDAQDPGQAYFSRSNLGSPDCITNIPQGTERSACSDCVEPTTIFGSASTDYGIYHCALYTYVTNDFRLGALSEADKNYLITNQVNTSLARAATITSTISTCLAEYCENLGNCKKMNVCSVAELNINGSILDADKVGSCVQSIFASHPEPEVNTDIAGIGILAAYIVQIGIALLIALILLGLVCFRKNDDVNSANQSVEPKQQGASRMKRFHDALLVALVEFLKAQCFLAMAISIAALVLVDSHDSLSMLDQMALVTASGVGILPTTFSLYILATFNPTRKSWFLYGLSLCTWILGFSVALSPHMAALNRRNKITDAWAFDNEFPNACGNASPIHLCYTARRPDLKPEYTFYYTLCLPIMLGLTIWQLSSISRISTFLDAIPIKKPRDTPWFWSVILHLGTIGLFVVPVYLFFKSISDLFSNYTVNSTWSFGQIIAVTVWIPTVAGLVNSFVDGVDVAHTKQLPARYTTQITCNMSS